MTLVNTDTVAGYKIVSSLGVVKGSVVRAKHLGKDIVARFRTIVGGEIKEYTEMFTDARQRATQRLVQDAESLEADAVVNLRFVTSQVMSGASELLVYGTAGTEPAGQIDIVPCRMTAENGLHLEAGSPALQVASQASRACLPDGRRASFPAFPR